jgi:hypothetical protein
LGGHPFTLISSTLIFLAFAWAVWWLTSHTAGAPDQPGAISTNRLAAALGGLLGWVLGVAFAPYSPEEKKQFALVGKTVSVFVSGYVVGKLDRFLELSLFSGATYRATAWERLGLFTSALILSALIVFIHRLYAFREDQKDVPG